MPAEAPLPGVIHPVDKAFYKLAVQERDYERVRGDRLEAERDRYRENYEALAVETGAILSRYREALEEIRGADPVDLALDPTWAQRIAEGALNEEAADDAPR